VTQVPSVGAPQHHRETGGGVPLVRPDAAEPGRWQRARELVVRHPVLSVFLVALLARVVVALITANVAGGSLFSDDSTYVRLAQQKASGDIGDWDDYTYSLYKTTSTFSVPLTLLFRVVGPSPLAGMLLVGLFGALAAALTTRTAMEVVSRPWSLVAGGVVALLPSQVLFSSLVLKDASVWAVLTALALLCAITGRVRGWRMLPLFALTSGCLYLLGNLRVQTLVAAAWAVALAALFSDPEQRWRRMAAAVGVAIVLPWTFSLGPAGLTFVADAQGTLEERRLANAQGAATAVVGKPKPKPTATPTPGTAAPPVSGDDAAAANLRYLPTGLRVVLLDPMPWNAGGNRRVQFALLENLLWWPLLGLAVVGALRMRTAGRAIAFPLLAGSAIAFLYALSEGNFGTAYRHRGEFVWAAAILAAVGLAHLWSTRRKPT
jgi:hypothetical protein